MKSLILVSCLIAFPVSTQFGKRQPTDFPGQVAIPSPTAPDQAAGSWIVNSQTAGPTPFITNLSLTVTPAGLLQSVRFTVSPKPGSVTRPVSALYTADYLQSRNYYNNVSGVVKVPVFGLYANYSNPVSVTCNFTDGTSQTQMVTCVTAVFSDNTCGYLTPTIIQARTNSTALSYDYMLVKSNCGSFSPLVIDTDGAIRWVGTAGTYSESAILFDNAIYMQSTPGNQSTLTGITRIDFDGAFTFIHDYANIGVTSVGHHNYDPGKRGMLVEVDTTTYQESVILEIDQCGTVLKTFNLATIISNAISAGGGNPATFVKTVNDSNHDWFHNNAATYRPSDDTLIVSSRENFVIALDYETGSIKWILGDTTKQWFSFAGLAQYALTLGPNTLAPTGQHALSITKDDNLLCFDNGHNSGGTHTPPGVERTYSAPRKYRIDTQAKVATEVWNFERGQASRSQFCSSTYEDAPLNYVIDYAQLVSPPPSGAPEILGMDALNNIIFDYRFGQTGCNTAWNTNIIHFENMVFTGPDPLNAPGGWHISKVQHNGNQAFVRFPAMAGKSYRLEYKDTLIDTTWHTVATTTPGCNGMADVTDTANGTQRYYRVLSL